MLILIPKLERLFALDPGVSHRGIDQRRILELRIRCLAADVCASCGSCEAAGDGDRRQAALKRCRQAPKPWNRGAIHQNRRCPFAHRRLARLRPRDSQAHIQQPVGAETARVAERDLLIQDALVTSRLALNRLRNGGKVDRRLLTVAYAQKVSCRRTRRVIQAKIALVGVVAKRDQHRVVISILAGACGTRQRQAFDCLECFHNLQ